VCWSAKYFSNGCNYVYNNEVGLRQEISDHDPVFIKIMANTVERVMETAK